ncbi:MAG: ThiF family adenylyltransferase [Chloroflexaceae bacterium]|jgi:molybdopterin/thiamine biosynthesis adenylyltransferase|nr:ThiF family adenylyltransferase [Chloroflexaceae bacterium]
MTFFLHESRYRDLSPAAERLVTVCGAGALGANLAESLARMGLHRLRVVDRDRIEAHNLSTQPWTQQDVGIPKARTLATALYRAVAARVEPQHVELTPANAVSLLQGSAVVVDAFDNLPSRHAVGAASASLGLPCLHIALATSGDYGCGLWDEHYKTENPRTENQEPRTDQHNAVVVLDACDYPLTRPLALLVAAAAAEVLVSHMLDGSRRNFELTLRDLRLTTTRL